MASAALVANSATQSKHWLATRWKAILAVVGLLLAGLIVFEYFQWLNSGMAFVDHVGHLRDHLWSLITTGNWTPAKYMWRSP